MSIVREWFRVTGGVDRRFYILSGLFLMIFKFAFDNLALWLVNGHFISPESYLLPLIELRKQLFDETPLAFQLGFVTWSLPFAFIGGNLSMRRAHSAGLSRGLGLLFFLPFLNFLAMIVLCCVPERKQTRGTPTSNKEFAGAIHIKDAIAAILAWQVVAAAMLGLSVYAMDAYGSALFMGTPFLTGFTAAMVLNQKRQYTTRQVLKIIAIANFVTAGLFISFALEGVICVTMAAPLAFAASVAGAMMGKKLWDGGGQAIALMALALPLMAFVEAPRLGEASRPVQTSFVVNASPEKVWPNVIGFSEIEVPRPWYFRSGIAMPLRARIDGEGVGAVRHCEFTTGSFVEPITVWEPPRRLAFTVESQPPTMEEWSPYSQIAPPHIEESILTSKRGEFLLEPLPDGKTKLIGTTWYDLDMAPNWYWALWSDAILHKIHERVLTHVAQLSEAQK